ncbi:MAG TPA: TPM domain-containing protein, partial [Puia sp.]|nr:TPM domain-containing protein [Puia sp.]
MYKLFKIFLLSYCLSVACTEAKAQGIPPKPSPATPVNDFAHVMTADQVDALDRKLEAYDDSTSTQIVIVTMPDIGGAAIDDYALNILRTWGVGSKKNNNGIVILADIKDRKVNIAVGYGLEGAIPDITAKEIIENEIVPNFRSGGTDNYYRGFDQAVDALIKAAAGQYHADNNGRHGRGSGNGIGLIIIVIIIIFLIIIRRGGGGRGGGGYFGGGGWWPFFLGTMVGRGFGGDRGGGWGGGGGGWGGGGGFGG